MRRFRGIAVVVAALSAVANAEAPTTAESALERCYEGTLHGRVVYAARVSACRRGGDRIRTDLHELRWGPAGGSPREGQECTVEDSSGTLVSIEIDRDGASAAASIAPEARELAFTFRKRGGLESAGRFALPGSAGLLGPAGKERCLVDAAARGETAVEYSVLSFTHDRPRVVRWFAVLVEATPDGCSEWVERSDDAETPLRTAYSADGLLRASLEVAGGVLELRRSHGIAASPTRAFAAVRIPALALGPLTRGPRTYRLQSRLLDLLPADDPFQARRGDCIVVRGETEAVGPPCPGSLLALDGADPALADAVATWIDTRFARLPEAPSATRLERVEEEVRELLGSLAASGSRTDGGSLARADCVGAAEVLCIASRLLGVPARLELGLLYSAPDRSWSPHAWVTAFREADGAWMHLDPLWPSASRSGYIRFASSPTPSVDGARVEAERLMRAAAGRDPIQECETGG